MRLAEYQKLCRKTAKKFRNKEKEILTWGLGLVGEAGGVAGCVKKTVSHKDNQKAGLRENLGDTMWYVAAICSFYGWDLEEVLAENIKKLEKRHPQGFSHRNARKNKRRDWNE